LIQKQADLATVKELLGHTSIKSTERYAHLSAEHLQRAVEGLKMGVGS